MTMAYRCAECHLLPRRRVPHLFLRPTHATVEDTRWVFECLACNLTWSLEARDGREEWRVVA